MIKTEHVLLVINPLSGGRDKFEDLQLISAFVTQRGHRFDLYQTTGKADAEAVNQLYKKSRYDRVLVGGGDGTIKMVCESLWGEQVIIGILPLGSANGLATDLDIPPDLEESLPVALGQHIKQIDSICINRSKCLHLSDLGLNAELVKRYEASKTRGKLGYALLLIPTLIGFNKNFSVKIETEKIKIKVKARRCYYSQLEQIRYRHHY